MKTISSFVKTFLLLFLILCSSSVFALVAIHSPADIGNSNVNSYSVSGSCSNSNSAVIVNVSFLTVVADCPSSGLWTTIEFDTSAIPDGPVLISAYHSNSQAASVLVQKNTSLADLVIGECSNQNEIPESQCQALVDLYNETGGENWTNNANWLDFSVPISNWYGVTTENNNVTVLSLFSNQLTGSIPESIGNFSGLTTLYLGDNELSGSIPETIGNLAALKILQIQYNDLVGSIPASVGNLLALERVNLERNDLTGSIPVSMGYLTSLESLLLNNNNLTGAIPDSFVNLTSMEHIMLMNNYLTGDLSVELLTALTLNSNNSMYDVFLYNNCFNDPTSDPEFPANFVIGGNVLIIPFGSAEYCAQSPSVQAGDFNDDGVINTNDLLAFLALFGTDGSLGGDFDGDGVVGAADHTHMLTLLNQTTDSPLESSGGTGGSVDGDDVPLMGFWMMTSDGGSGTADGSELTSSEESSEDLSDSTLQSTVDENELSTSLALKYDDQGQRILDEKAYAKMGHMPAGEVEKYAAKRKLEIDTKMQKEMDELIKTDSDKSSQETDSTINKTSR